MCTEENREYTDDLTDEFLPENEEPVAEDDRQCFCDRELSWLQFNLRVLTEAATPDVPLLERLKFLNIYRSNLEEFFMVRVGSLTHRSLLLPDSRDEKTGWTPSVQVRNILAEVSRQQETEEKIYRDILSELKTAGTEIVNFRKLSKTDEAIAQKFFADIRPLLSPQIVDNTHPFPFMDNKEVWIAAGLKRGENFRLGLVNLQRLPPWRSFETDNKQKIILTADLVQHYAQQLFKKENLRETAAIRVTRNADVFMDYYMSVYDEDAKAGTKKMLRRRARQQPVRLEVAGKISEKMRSSLVKELNVPEKNVFSTAIPLDISFSSGVKKTPEMKYPERRPQKNVKLQKGEILAYLEQKDLLLAFPFQSISPFVDFLYEAADDPDVVSIQITLYRLSASSKVAAALAYAADRGKDVLCLLELRARFDEQNNIDYSEVLENAGCRIIYGLPDMKVHSKLCLITRQKNGQLQRFTQVGTGNYNESTAEQYTDLSLMTSDAAVGEDAAATFEALALGQTPPKTEHLWVAPKSYRSRVLDMISAETEKGENGRIAIKVNSMNDIGVMRELIHASRCGVKIEMFIRGICCLLPGIQGSTENLSVHSTVGRYLEHSRIFCFGEGDTQRVFLGSGDLLNRNTRRRVECFIECVDPEVRADVLAVLDAMRSDKEKSWTLLPDESYERTVSEKGTASQDVLYEYFGSRTVESTVKPIKKKGIFRRFFGRLFSRKKS